MLSQNKNGDSFRDMLATKDLSIAHADAISHTDHVNKPITIVASINQVIFVTTDTAKAVIMIPPVNQKSHP